MRCRLLLLLIVVSVSHAAARAVCMVHRCHSVQCLPYHFSLLLVCAKQSLMLCSCVFFIQPHRAEADCFASVTLFFLLRKPISPHSLDGACVVRSEHAANFSCPKIHKYTTVALTNITGILESYVHDRRSVHNHQPAIACQSKISS